VTLSPNSDAARRPARVQAPYPVSMGPFFLYAAGIVDNPTFEVHVFKREQVELAELSNNFATSLI
jgi:hypothetical protein